MGQREKTQQSPFLCLKFQASAYIGHCALIFFFYEIDVGRSCTKKVQPLKAWISSPSRKEKKRGDFMD